MSDKEGVLTSEQVADKIMEVVHGLLTKLEQTDDTDSIHAYSTAIQRIATLVRVN